VSRSDESQIDSQPLSWTLFSMIAMTRSLILDLTYSFYVIVGPVGFLGGSVIATAVYIVASNEGNDNNVVSEPKSESGSR